MRTAIDFDVWESMVLGMNFAATVLGYAIRLGYRRVLAPSPDHSKYLSRHSARRINALMPLSGSGGRYLEIGVERGLTFEAVRADFKVCVDPAPLFRKDSLSTGAQLVVSTSDDFFAGGASEDTFDFVFLDGLHTAEATYRDLVGALKRLSPGGTILIDDVMPTDEASSLPSYRDSQVEKRKQGIAHSRWYGDVWRVVWLLVTKHTEFEVILVGAGGDDHTQAIVKSADGSGSFGSNPSSDLAFMESLNFCDVVTEEGLAALALPEKAALSSVTS